MWFWSRIKVDCASCCLAQNLVQRRTAGCVNDGLFLLFLGKHKAAGTMLFACWGGAPGAALNDVPTTSFFPSWKRPRLTTWIATPRTTYQGWNKAYTSFSCPPLSASSDFCAWDSILCCLQVSMCMHVSNCSRYVYTQVQVLDLCSKWNNAPSLNKDSISWHVSHRLIHAGLGHFPSNKKPL